MTADETRPEHVVHETTDRGFKHLPAIPSTHGGEITTYESSSATRPALWVRIREAMPGSVEKEAVVHLTLQDAAKLADQLNWLIAHHYQGDDGGPR